MSDFTTEIGVSMSDIETRQCRWPVSPDNVPVSDFRFCGDTGEGTYCKKHNRIAFRTLQKIKG